LHDVLVESAKILKFFAGALELGVELHGEDADGSDASGGASDGEKQF
jgi:hypothetical protein